MIVVVAVVVVVVVVVIVVVVVVVVIVVVVVVVIDSLAHGPLTRVLACVVISARLEEGGGAKSPPG